MHNLLQVLRKHACPLNLSDTLQSLEGLIANSPSDQPMQQSVHSQQGLPVSLRIKRKPRQGQGPCSWGQPPAYWSNFISYLSSYPTQCFSTYLALKNIGIYRMPGVVFWKWCWILRVRRAISQFKTYFSTTLPLSPHWDSISASILKGYYWLPIPPLVPMVNITNKFLVSIKPRWSFRILLNSFLSS